MHMIEKRRNYTLVPFHAAEGLTMKQASIVAGKSERTVRNWCVEPRPQSRSPSPGPGLRPQP